MEKLNLLCKLEKLTKIFDFCGRAHTSYGDLGIARECQSGQMGRVKGALAYAYGGSNPPSLI